jgi:competence protein ComEC
LVAQLAITLGLVPLTLALFQQVSLVGPLANAVAIPLVSLVITPLALLAAVLPFDVIAHLAHALQSGLMVYLEWLGGFDWAVWQQASPPLPVVVLGAIGALWLLVPWWWSWRALGAVWMLPLFLHAPAPLPGGDVEVTVLDVGQGLAVVARTSAHTLLFDTGPAYSPDADGGNRVIVPFLRGAGIRRLDGMLVSHDDDDHSGGALSVLEAVPAGWFASPLGSTHPIITAAGARARPCQAGQQWEWDGVRFEILHPLASDYANFAGARDNAQSCVLKITAHGRSMLLPADTERDVEARQVRTQAAALRSEVLVAPHHGSQTSSTAPWIAAVGASTVIFPVGYRNRFRHPAQEVVERYRQSGAQLLRTDQAGAVTVRIDAAGVRTESYRAARPRYWYGR